jgi:hypothetical protein
MSLVVGERVLSGDRARLSTIGDSFPTMKVAVDSVGAGHGSLFGDSSGLAAVNTGEYSVTTSDVR